MWWLSNPQDLHRVEDRVSTLYVEKCHVDRDDNAVVLVNKERTVRVPAAFVATVLLGPGTRITSAAVRLLADSGTALCWVGDRGVRMYAAGLGPSRGAGLLMRQAYLVTRTSERLDVARRMYAKRFPDDDVTTATMQQLRGREGARIKKIYRDHATRTGVTWNKRVYTHGDPFADSDDINRLLSAGHSCLYGICHAAIVGIGASPALGFVHTGAATSFVLDIADLYKADYTIPLAFDLAAAGLTDERDIRTAFRDKVADGHLMARIIHDIKDLLIEEGTRDNDEDALHLWDELDGHVPGGVNWAADLADQTDDTTILGVTGPDTDQPPPPW
ncbi:CRISPR-associated protein, Cas1 family [Frankia casuarinae]|uniref:CRISPR-associated endonuclease Cas1 n=2 Tax=Frankia casuarinae (strain DSM 45818 / CECT 9043 / HFP020203 / CcI3) TaxID=106370 RepID=Q2JH25_FRACC|nr:MULTISPECIES: type I-E CRISPR-associated endonuclease Cas1e [Frankia]ABD09417.1 CRISPR-associated protein, Cas1 family [Frankia casuarinae]ETA02746.1 CRISPR-associated protein, Cas1 family [Frankia sp. CcI6]EYT94181.1 CRISPR-associated protein, Cas1 family [Frankia casuarinae]KDA44373.1 CRISPR-associated protein, Cas1 family [Frankia sp. BMG5.23]OAA31114.1 CRISPR-associated protein, Cas1 family [Frankia casuarinae]